MNDIFIFVIFFATTYSFARILVLSRKIAKLQTEHDSLWEWINHFATITEEDAAQPGDDHD